MKGERQNQAEGNLLSDENQKSVNILNAIQNADWFRQVGDNVRLYFRSNGALRPSGLEFPITDFLKAVDYYYDNRDAEIAVNLAMAKPDGKVRVYAPETVTNVGRPVVLEIKNYMVPQILEFAYLLTRRSDKK